MTLYQLNISESVDCVMVGRNHRITSREGTKPHRLSHNLFIFIISGKAEFLMETYKIPVERGTVLLIPKGNSYSLASPDGVDFFFFHFCGDLISCHTAPDYCLYHSENPFALQPIEPRLIYIPESQSLEIRYAEFFSRISNCIAHIAETTYSSHLLIDIEFQRILILLNEIIEKKANDKTSPILTKIVAFIRKNQNSLYTVKDISREFSLSPSYIARLFKKHYNMTPTTYIIHEKMTYARTLIQYGDMNISEIASYLGYNDVYYFSRLYKKTFGQSPTKDRING